MSDDPRRGDAVRVALVSAGRGMALFELLATAPCVQVVAVAGPDAEARGLARARAIPVLESHHGVFAYDPQIVIELGERPQVVQDLVRAKASDVEVIGPHSARLLRDLLALQSSEARQVEKAETMRRLAGGPFHGLKNVLTILLGRSQLLLRSIENGMATPGDVSKGLRVIAEQAANVGVILNRILDHLNGFAPEPAGDLVTRVAVNDLVREGLAFIEPLIREAEAQAAPIEVRQLLGDIAPVLGRPSELTEVFVNLIVNAVEAMPEGGILTVETAPEHGRVCIRVTDTGVGMPEAVRAQLFSPFFTTKPGGTGLGLNIARDIVRRHGGEIVVESVEGKGSTFTIRLAAAEIVPTLVGGSGEEPSPGVRRQS